MTPLVELYDPENLPRVLEAGATLIGINNRDLRTFKTDLDHTLRLREKVPDTFVLVAESGIRTRADVERLGSGRRRCDSGRRNADGQCGYRRGRRFVARKAWLIGFTFLWMVMFAPKPGEFPAGYT